MSRPLAHVLWVLPVLVAAARADQYAWCSEPVARAARERLETMRVLVSFCSLCPDQRVEVWELERVRTQPVGLDRHCQVQVLSRPLCHSLERFQTGEYREPWTPVATIPEEGREPAFRWRDLDLAYTYVQPPGTRVFVCLAALLGLPVEIRVPQLHVPPGWLAGLESRDQESELTRAFRSLERWSAASPPLEDRAARWLAEELACLPEPTTSTLVLLEPGGPGTPLRRLYVAHLGWIVVVALLDGDLDVLDAAVRPAKGGYSLCVSGSGETLTLTLHRHPGTGMFVDRSLHVELEDGILVLTDAR